MTWGHINNPADTGALALAARRAAELDAFEAWAENMADVFTAAAGDVERVAYLEGALSGFADVGAGIGWLRERKYAAGDTADALATWVTERCMEALREADAARDPLELAHACGRAVAFDKARMRFRQSPSPVGVSLPDGERG